MKKLFPQLFALALLLLSSTSSLAYITYNNGRLDHVLYSAHDTKTVVHVVIEKREEEESAASPDPRICFDWYARSTGWFRVQHIVLGTDSLAGKLLQINTTSFNWPEDLVSYTEKTECILVLNKHAGDTVYSIAAVVPVFHQSFEKVYTNAAAIPVLEREVLAVLAAEKNPVRQVELLRQVGPVLRKENQEQVRAFIKSENIWVKRTALAAVVYVGEKKADLEMLAVDIDSFFANHAEGEMIADIKGQKGYAPWPYYFNHVFFLEGSSMQYGTRWDEAEASRNQRLYHQLVSTGLMGKKARTRLEKQ